MTFHHLLHLIDTSAAYRVALSFTGVYPVFMALVWMICSALFFFRQERVKISEPKEWPFVSILIPAYAEEKFEASLNALLNLD